MPNINEFLYKKEKILKPEMEKLAGFRGCTKCEDQVDGAFWDPIERVMSWTCKDGHENRFQVD